MNDTIDVEGIRRTEFAWMNEGETIYMNAASTGPLPERSIVAQNDFTRKRGAPHLVGFDAQFGALARCRELVAGMIGATSDEIALAINTGAGINLAAWGLPLGAGDGVVVSDLEFPANRYPWMAAAEARGFDLHVVATREGIIDEDALVAALDRPGVKLLTVSWVGFSTGALVDLERLGNACRERGIWFVVDGIQGLGALTIDMQRLPVDMFACGAQKWLLAPWGTGFTYVRREMIALVTPQPVSWMGVRDSDDFSRLVDYDMTWRDSARRFEQVTLPYQDFTGLASSLEFLRETGFAAVSQHIVSSTAALLSGARDLGIAPVTSMSRHAGIASVRPPDAVAASARLEAAGVIHSLREGTIRLAPHCYTNADDIQRTLHALSFGA
ncbi:MAG: aminotransferase class V-fold PLP-dependent enzyme [Gemmatimonadaceae bacterium]